MANTHRTAEVKRTTSESDVSVWLDLDGTGSSEISTGIGFYDHMLTALSKHSLIDMKITTTGDLHIDGHHSIDGVRGVQDRDDELAGVTGISTWVLVAI